MDGRATERRRALTLSDLRAHPATVVATMALGLVVGANLWVYLASARTALTTPYSLDYVEGFLVTIAADPGLWYHPVERGPHLVTSYPPVYYALTGVLSTVLDPLVAGRLVTILATIALATLVAATVRSITGGAPLAAGLAAALVLASPLTAFWGVFARVDVLGVTLGVAALYWYHTREGRRAPVGAGLLCLCSLFTKQSLLAAPAAILLSSVAAREYRRAAGFAAGLGLAGLAGLAAMHLLTGGRSTLHMVVYNQQPPAPTRFLFFVGSFVTVHALLLAAAGVAATDPEVPAVYRAYAGASVGVAALAVKAGSQFNFFLDALVASAVLVGVLVGTRFERPAAPGGPARAPDRVGREWVVTAVLLAATLQFGLFWAGGFFAGLPERPDAGAADAGETLSGVEGPVLSEDAGLLTATGHRVRYQPNLMRSLSRSGRWDQGPVIDRIRDRRYGAVVLKSPLYSTEWPHRFTAAQEAAIDRHYDLARRTGTYWVYVPETPAEFRETGRVRARGN